MAVHNRIYANDITNLEVHHFQWDLKIEFSTTTKETNEYLTIVNIIRGNFVHSMRLLRYTVL